MYHYDPDAALMELKEEGLLPNAVHMRDMVFRAHLDTPGSIAVNRLLKDYIAHFSDTLEKGREILERLNSTGEQRASDGAH